MQEVMDFLAAMRVSVEAFWAAITSLGVVFDAFARTRTAQNLSTLTWAELWQMLTGESTNLLVAGTVFTFRAIDWVASVVSAVTTIIGVRYYFRQTNEYSLKKKFEAMQEIIALTVDLRGEIAEVHNVDGINDARKELNRYLISRESLFDASLRDGLRAQRTDINTTSKTLIRQDRSHAEGVTSRAKTDELNLSTYKKLDQQLEALKKYTEEQSAVLLTEIQRSAATLV